MSIVNSAGKIAIGIVGGYIVGNALVAGMKTIMHPDTRDVLTQFAENFEEEIKEDVSHLRDWIELVRALASEDMEAAYD